MKSFPFPRPLTLVLLIATALVGCGGEDSPELGEVSGIVTNGETPVSGATVGFYPTEGRPSFATTGPDGRYELAYTADHPGAILGKHSVRVTISSANAAPTGGEEVLETPVRTVVVPSPVTVEEGENTVDIDLTTTTPLTPGRSGGQREVLEPPSR